MNKKGNTEEIIERLFSILSSEKDSIEFLKAVSEFSKFYEIDKKEQ